MGAMVYRFLQLPGRVPVPENLFKHIVYLLRGVYTERQLTFTQCIKILNAACDPVTLTSAQFSWQRCCACLAQASQAWVALAVEPRDDRWRYCATDLSTMVLK